MLSIRWDTLLKVGESEYEKDTMTRQANNERDKVVVLICSINFYNIQNLIHLITKVRYAIHNY